MLKQAAYLKNGLHLWLTLLVLICNITIIISFFLIHSREQLLYPKLYYILSVCMFFSASTIPFIAYLTARQIKLKDAVASRTAELEQANELLKQEVLTRRQAEQTAKTHKQDLETILDLIPYSITRFDCNLRHTYVNPGITNTSGYPPDFFLNKPIDQLDCDMSYREFWHAKLTEVLNHKQPLVFEWSWPGARQEPRFFKSRLIPQLNQDGSVAYILRITHDITERKVMTEQIARLERLNIVGEMAASIGHEVRNPMTTVRGFLQMMLRKPQYSEHAEHFKIMIEELDRANSILSEFLSLAKNKKVELCRCNLNTIVRNLYPLLRASALMDNKDIVLNLNSVPDLDLDEKEIRQLILNLARNGLEAMNGRGTLTLKTYTEQNKVVLAVQDEGSGLSAEIISKIGTPFFTTKENGTGLGLAVCYNIAAHHQADISFTTGKDGTTFCIAFPLPSGASNGSRPSRHHG